MAQHEQFKPGELVGGRYVILEEVGSGAFGSVFRAKDEHLRREVALKQLRDLDPEHARRFLAEARAQNSVKSENVVTVIDHAADADGRVYIVMEYLTGGSLEAYLLKQPEGRLGWEVAMNVLRQALRGLDAIHKNGLVHRDLKLSNLVLARGAEAPPMTIKIVDFGLACDGPAQGDAPTLDASHPAIKDRIETAAGTPLYAAPEQLRPPYRSDYRTDLFALGVIAYRLLSGAFPRYAATVMEYLRMLEQRVPVKSLLDLHPDIPRSLVQVVERAIDPRPEERLQSVAEFSGALDRVALERPPTSARPKELLHRLPGGLGVLLYAVPVTELVRPGTGDVYRSHASFYASRFPTTVGEFRRFVDATRYRTLAERQRKPWDWRRPGFPQGDENPVVWVCHDDALAYCQWAGLRLLSADEWRAAAFGTRSRGFPWGEDPPEPRHLWWDAPDGTRPVGRHRDGASPFDLEDLAGNVWEWTSTVRRGDARVILGGGWRDHDPALLTRDYENELASRSCGDDLGFRCAKGGDRT